MCGFFCCLCISHTPMEIFLVCEGVYIPSREGKSHCAHAVWAILSLSTFFSNLEHQIDNVNNFFVLLYCIALREESTEGESRYDAKWERIECFFGVELFKARWTAENEKFKMSKWHSAKGFSRKVHVVFHDILDTWEFLEANAARFPGAK